MALPSPPQVPIAKTSSMNEGSSEGFTDLQDKVSMCQPVLASPCLSHNKPASLTTMGLFFPRYSLQCIQCSALGLSSCTEGPIITCPSGHVCTSTYQQTTKDGKTDEFLYRSCGPTSHCNKAGSFSVVNKNIRMGVSCCSTDNCTAPLPILPPASTRSNGNVCPMCADTNEACEEITTMDCVGSENKCLLQVTEIKGTTGNVQSYRGCTTRSICDIGSQSITMGILSMESTYLCNGGAITMARALGVSTVTALVLLILLH
ncbi:phospholipase A2 inhibitor gamma subunit B-like [Hyla sarda]|uniref:phospholipase A2 inhibitor gamma subunit B-like n=1 Tax=Hyla sarda TaxID=327740 RepID=UPI0024C2DC6B|nr:phospholipase A2 inhibitor gamma subunit B-like [Hyla sarda]